MPIVVPGVAKNYQSPLKAIASTFGKEPNEGRYQIPVEILWGTANMGGPNNLVSFNLQNSGDTKAISQICAVHLDNSGCGADIEFIFTDTAETVVIPAYTPYVLVPLFSRSLQFFVQAGINGGVVQSTDITRFTLFNFVPPPVAVPVTQEQNQAAQSLIPMDGATVTQLIPATQTGTLEGISVFASGPIAAGGTISFALQDNGGAVFGVGQISCGAGDVLNVQALTLPMCYRRFSSGVKMTQAGTNMGGKFSVNLLYRVP